MTKEEITQKYANRNKNHIIALCGCNNYKDNVDLYCTKHNYKWSAQLGSNLYKKYSCSECAKEGIRDNLKNKYNLWEINYDVAKLLENPSDAYGLSSNSKEKRWFICPNCGNRLYKRIAMVSNFGLSCHICSDGFSYPNKLMYNILTELGLNFITEFSPSWISPRRYDFCIEKNKIIIEMDGELGHGKRVRKDNIISSEESLKIDNLKDNIAIQHGYKVIRINCDKSELYYIKYNIMNSDLINYIDFTDVKWEDCDLKSQKSILISVCEFYNQNPYYSYKMLSQRFNINVDTINKYLKIGYEHNLCPKYSKCLSNPIICVESGVIFPTATKCAEFYNLDSSQIIKCCKNEKYSTYNLHFMYLNSYDKKYKRKEPNYDIKPYYTSNKRKINMYNKEFKYITTYESITEAAKKNNKTLRLIIKSCNSKHSFNYGKTFYYADDPNQPDHTKIINSNIPSYEVCI